MDDSHAIKRLKRGDIGGLAALVERYQMQAVRTAYLITGDRAMAEDVVQAAFLHAYKAIQGFDNQRPFAPWFLRSVANAAIQAARRGQREASLDESPDFGVETFADLLPDPAPIPDDAAEQAELRRAVWGALQSLSPEQRAAIVLRYFLDLSESEMSARLDCPPGTVKWRLHAAKKRLRALLGAAEG
jgi:RNA polymerase sigma-70 factor, ECF subfamily